MIDFILVVLSILLAIPVLVLFIQVVMALNVSVAKIDETPIERAKIAVLVPAHNEEFVIGETITVLKTQLEEDDRLLVIADNCSDDTAEIAIGLDVEVVNRTDEEKRGKGYALDFGINHLKQDNNAPEVVIVIDADCNVQEDCLDRLINQCIQTGRPAQALYLMKSHSSKLGRKIAEFAWIVKNQVRALGYFRMGLPCQLTGTGMAFPYHLIVDADLANADLVEDMKLGINMARKGYSPLFCPGATVVSRFPGEEQGISSQRTRWEHGHLGTILTEGPGLMGLAIKKRDFNLLAMALDLMVPPLALLSILLVVALTTTGIFYFLTANNLPFLIILGASSIFTLSVLLALHGFARHVLSMKDLLGVPVYIARKIPLYFRFWSRRQKDWIRTDRDENL